MTVLLHFEGKVLCIADTTRLNCLDCYSVSIGYSNLFLCSSFKLLPKIKNRWISNRSWSKCQYIYLSDSSWPRSTPSICWKKIPKKSTKTLWWMRLKYTIDQEEGLALAVLDADW